MSTRPKGMPRWEWMHILEKEKEDLAAKKSFEKPQQPNMLGIITAVFIMVLIIWVIFASMSGEPDNSCSQGYHLEGYTTSYGETVVDCVPN